MLVPLLFFPDACRVVASAAVGLFGADAAALFSWAFPPAFRLAVWATLAAVAALFLLRAAGDLAWGRRVLLPVALETLLLFTFFAFVPPVLAVGLYFALWHAPRHVARLVLLDPAGYRYLGAGRSTRALGRFAAEAAPLTVLALAFLVALYLVVPRTAERPRLASRPLPCARLRAHAAARGDRRFHGLAAGRLAPVLGRQPSSRTLRHDAGVGAARSVLRPAPGPCEGAIQVYSTRAGVTCSLLEGYGDS